ncbi:hypothetical protein [Actinoallomurus soli]|uniref:hypothetical protein n=1 Tax=Actinoallomurus soli TaxID=2952535 RepID=UPI0020930F56|nr:hypothetical protein [Actinoallomurus soli]MCO5972890.1 hypothetical protein [Actinoallomurus soli]
MAERSGHSTNCEKAEKPPCACQCGGAEHGWQGAIAIAAAPSDRDLLRLEREADQAWSQAERRRTDQRKPGPQTSAGRQAAIKAFVAEVIRWLRRDPNLRQATKQLGEPFRISRDTDPDGLRRRLTAEQEERFVEAHVIPGLRKEFGDQRIKDFQRKAGTAHFWCELLAQTAHALDEFRGRYNQARRAVAAVLTSAGERRPDGWTALLSEKDVIERAVELVFKHLPRVATGGIAVQDAFNLIWPARILAVLMCREPRRHPAVREYCVKPIVRYGAAEIQARVKDRLRQAFPLDWPELSGPDEDTNDLT